MESIVPIFVIFIIVCNIVGVLFLFVLSEREKKSRYKLQFSADFKSATNGRILRNFREIAGFISLLIAAMGIISLFFNGFYEFGLISSVVFIFSLGFFALIKV